MLYIKEKNRIKKIDIFLSFEILVFFVKVVVENILKKLIDESWNLVKPKVREKNYEN